MKTPNRHHRRMTDLNFELYFVTEVLGLRSLHYGYWDETRPGDHLDLAEIKAAQARFTERLLEFVPPETKAVLDVGAGIGDNAQALSASGRQVTAISPDENHQRYFDQFGDPNIAFTRSKFETFASEEVFDLILFSESHRYFNRQVGLEQARRFLRPGGYLLVSGMFRYEDKKPFPKDFDLRALPYIRMAGEYGFEPVRVNDISDHIFPTIRMAHRAMLDIALPTVRFAEAYLEARSPWKTRLFRLFLSKEDKEFDRAIMKLLRKTNPERFRERYRYATILFKASTPSTSADVS